MFHQVAPIGPFDGGTRLVTPSAQLAPVGDGTGDWAVTDHGALEYRAPLDAFRVSVLWKADVYPTAAEREQRLGDTLLMDDVADTFNDDLARRGSSVRFDLARLDDPSLKAVLAEVYPEAVPVHYVRCVLSCPVDRTSGPTESVQYRGVVGIRVGMEGACALVTFGLPHRRERHAGRSGRNLMLAALLAQMYGRSCARRAH